ncbi:MAG: GNAT family N-acetyltransferase [bacterium]|nr:GNAT family N-acetyltransferase [bacterium]
MSVEVRMATQSDRSRCLELLDALAQVAGGSIHSAAGAAFDALLEQERGEILVAEEDGVVLGLASVSFNLAMRYGGEYCQLEELIVDPAARGKDVGGLLVRETVHRARQRGCADYGLYLVEATERNQPFYEKFGFRKVGSEMRQQLT